MSSLISRASLKSTINWERLYLYMFDSWFRIPRAKYILDPRSEMGLNTYLFSSSYCCRVEDLFRDFVTICDFCFVLFKESIRDLF